MMVAPALSLLNNNRAEFDTAKVKYTMLRSFYLRRVYFLRLHKFQFHLRHMLACGFVGTLTLLSDELCCTDLHVGTVLSFS